MYATAIRDDTESMTTSHDDGSQFTGRKSADLTRPSADIERKDIECERNKRKGLPTIDLTAKKCPVEELPGLLRKAP